MQSTRVFVVALAVFGCKEVAQPQPDGGTPPGDSGVMQTQDAGSMNPQDGGTNQDDGGTMNPQDAGAFDAGNQEPFPTTGTATGIPTFESIGFYWSPTGGSTSRTCALEYRIAGDVPFKAGQPLWFDARNGEYRGSLVNLRPGTAYQVRLRLSGTPAAESTLTVNTWSEHFPIGNTVTLPATSSAQLDLGAAQSGTAGGYTLYTVGPSGSAVIPSTTSWTALAERTTSALAGKDTFTSSTDAVALFENGARSVSVPILIRAPIVDAGTLDAGPGDAGIADAGSSQDAGLGDAGVEAAGVDAGVVGCGCQSAGEFTFVLVSVWLLRRRRSVRAQSNDDIT